MDAPALTDSSRTAGLPAWRPLLLPLGLGLLLLAAAFPQEIAAAVRTWTDSTAYNHCFLVIPIAAYLLWDRRLDLDGLAPQPASGLALIGVPIAVIWLVSERLGIMEGRQIAVVSFVEVLFLAVLGKRLWWAAAGPLLYLYFLVPFGAFLTPGLQDVTTFFIRHGLEILGVPAYIDGYTIEIPQGTFFVAEACAGLRFLIASIAFGCLYALIMYRTPVRRGVFILASVIVPIVANGIRGIGIVYLGYLLGSAQAAAADHILYGWIFFSIVILLLILLGLPFRQDHFPPAERPVVQGQPVTPRPASNAVFAVAVVAAAGPLLTTSLAASAANPLPALTTIDVGDGCRTVPGRRDDARIGRQRVICGTVTMDMVWEAFSPHVTASPVMTERRRLSRRAMTEVLNESWLAEPDGQLGAWRIMTSVKPAFALAIGIWIDGRPVRPGLAMRARMAMNSLFGSGHAPVVMSVTPAVDWDRLTPVEANAARTSLRDFLLAHPDLADRIGARSVLP